MKERQWRSICIGSIILTVLVIGRCIATAMMARYYGRSDWMADILQDFWFYAGIVAAVVGVVAAVMWIVTHRKG